MIETDRDMGGERLNPKSEFNFACHSGLACFNSCCANKRLPLFPYDMLRLRRALKLESQEVLARYTQMEEDPVSGWPALRLSLTDEGRCPLVGGAGCTVYKHRPSACRLYPLAWAVVPAGPEKKWGQVFVLQDTPSCHGWNEPVTHTRDSWVEDQGLDPYLEANAEISRLLFHPGRKGKLKLNPRQTHAVIAALYNLDIFRRMVSEKLLVEFAPEKANKNAKAVSDEDLLRTGQRWLAKSLFGSII